MLTDLLFIALFFITRIGLPIAVTYVLGVSIERALKPTASPDTLRAPALIEHHAH